MLIFIFGLGGRGPVLGEESRPVLIELFTSQGCSSCSSADKRLSTWDQGEFEKGNIVPLAFHVDYWDSMGWKDPLGSAEGTKRQRAYAAVFRSDAVYTPQMIMTGSVGFVGSDGGRARTEVDRFSKERAAAHIQIDGKIGEGRLACEVTARLLEKGPRFENTRVMAAVFENGLMTSVRRGENSGRVLKVDFVVRRLVDWGGFRGDEVFQGTFQSPWEPGWDSRQAGIAVFLQDAVTLRVTAAKAIYPISK